MRTWPVTEGPDWSLGFSIDTLARASSPNILRAYRLAAMKPHSPANAWQIAWNILSVTRCDREPGARGILGFAPWWEHSLSTNVVLDRVRLYRRYVGWVCWFCTLFWDFFSPGTRSHQKLTFGMIWPDVFSLPNWPLGYITLRFKVVMKERSDFPQVRQVVSRARERQ